MTVIGTVKDITTDYVINAAGNSLDIAHSIDLAKEYTDLHFRGRILDSFHKNMVTLPEGVFIRTHDIQSILLDPHWIIRNDGRCEVGPNAVPVFGPYSYTLYDNLKNVAPKLF